MIDFYSKIETEKLLTMLDKERRKFTSCDKKIIGAMVGELIRRGEYHPTPEKNPNSILTMVECYGARWHRWKGILACPHCKSDQRCHDTGAPYLRSIGLYANDRTYAFRCPDCKGEWSREENDREEKS